MTTASQTAPRLQIVWAEVVEKATARRLAVIAFVLGAVVMLAYRPFKQMESGDPAIYDYIAQSILRGQMPYRDIIDPKGPLSMYLSAAAMAVGHLFGVRDVLAVRGLHVILMALLSMVTFLAAEAYLRNRAAALIACLVLLMRKETALLMIQGTQPKLSMMLFGMLTLLFIAKDRPVWAGVCSMLSCLCWQPGLLFTGTAVLIFSRYLTRWRDGRALKVMAGAMVPLVMTVLYFYARGALGDMVEWTLVYPYSSFTVHREKTLAVALGHVWNVIYRVFQGDVALIGLGLVGFVTFAFARLRAKFKGWEWLQSADLFKDAILFPPPIYLAFCLINMQGGPDLIPFFPFIGIFAGWFVVEAARLIGAGRWAGALTPRLAAWIPRLAIATIALLMISRAAAYRFEGWTVQYQDKLLKESFAGLGPDDRFYIHGPAEILLLLNRPNLNRYIVFNHGADEYVDAKKPGGFAALIAEMEAQAPKFVAMSRLKNLAHGEELQAWMLAHYERMPINGYEIYVRKQAAPNESAGPSDISPLSKGKKKRDK